MPSHGLVRKDNLVVIIAVISALVITSSSISNYYGYFDITKVAYGQPDPNQTNSNTTNSVNLQNIHLKKVHVGDIDVAYKMFGRGEPLILFNGASDSMDAWDPSFLTGLASNHTVIVFDQRGIANSTAFYCFSYKIKSSPFCLLLAHNHGLILIQPSSNGRSFQV